MEEFITSGDNSFIKYAIIFYLWTYMTDKQSEQANWNPSKLKPKSPVLTAMPAVVVWRSCLSLIRECLNVILNSISGEGWPWHGWMTAGAQHWIETPWCVKFMRRDRWSAVSLRWAMPIVLMSETLTCKFLYYYIPLLIIYQPFNNHYDTNFNHQP